MDPESNLIKNKVPVTCVTLLEMMGLLISCATYGIYFYQNCKSRKIPVNRSSLGACLHIVLPCTKLTSYKKTELQDFWISFKQYH